MDKRDALRASLAGTEAIAVRAAAEVLYETGGKQLLTEGARGALRHVLGEVTKGYRALPVLVRAGSTRALELGARGSHAQAPGLAVIVVSQGVKSAVKEVAKGVGRAAGAGLLLDGAFGVGDALVRLHKGEMTRKAAVIHAVKEAGTGAVASAAGVAVAAAAVAVTGGLATPVLIGVAAGGSFLTKMGLAALLPKTML